MAADKFSNSVRQALKLRAGTVCSNPSCMCQTTGPHSDSSRAITVGEAAHITAASPGGPRYDSSLSSEQRKSAANGVWLCSKCADLVDKDPDSYSVALLRSWKQGRESEALARIAGCPAPASVDSGALGRFAIIPIPKRYAKRLGTDANAEQSLESMLAIEAIAHSNEGRLDQAIDLFAHLCVTSSSFEVLRLCWAFYYRIAELDDALGLARRMGEVAGSDVESCTASHCEGLTLLDLGRPNHSRRAFKLALTHAKAASRDDLIAQQVTGMGLVNLLTGANKDAEDAFLRSLDLCETEVFGEGAAFNLGCLGQLYMQDGRFEEAEKAHRRALSICERCDDRKGQALQLCNLGLISSAKENDIDAEKYHRQALAIDEKIGWKKGIAGHSANIGRILLSRGEPEAAQPFLKQAQDLFDELGDYSLAYSAYHSMDAVPSF